MSDTREYIIVEAFKLFLAKSYEAVSISDISNAIGLTKGALYHHFVNKEELFKAVIDKHLSIVPINFDPRNCTLPEFNKKCIAHAEAILRKLFIDSAEFIPIDYVSLIADSFRHYQGFASEKVKMMNEERERIQTMLNNAIKRNEIRDDINVEAISQIYVSNMLGMAGPFIEKKPVESILETLRLQLDEFYKLLKR
ncbi:MAG TPA: TetR/AcrR family transcriptional regulator [Bacteroidales bacterium]|nr:TetR/AcrR family transcriptional regulator [Bacteroidales bacterium]